MNNSKPNFASSQPSVSLRLCLFENLFQMLLSSAIHVIAIDLSIDDYTYTRAMQRQMLDRMLCISHLPEDIRIENIIEYGLISDVKLVSDPCRWEKVVCDKKEVLEIDWRDDLRIGFIDINWLPPTLMRAKFVGQRIESIDTKRLPRELRYLNVFGCGLSSSIAFHTLPAKIEELNLSDKNISGTLCFYDLPDRIREIDLRWNLIHCLMVENASLPESLEFILVRQRKVRMVALGGGKLDKRVILERPYS